MWSVWLSVDPLAEQMPEWSSYNYTFSNPIKFPDPTGMAPEGSIDPPKWMKKLYRAMKESFSRGHAHKSRVKTFKRDMNSLAKYSGFMDGTGPRDKLEEGISIKTDKPTNGGMVSVPFSDRNANVKIIDESIISAATGLTGKVNGNPKSFIDHVETVVNIADKGQRFSELGSNSNGNGSEIITQTKFIVNQYSTDNQGGLLKTTDTLPYGLGEIINTRNMTKVNNRDSFSGREIQIKYQKR